MDTDQMDSRTAFFRAVTAGDAAQVRTLLEREPWLARERSPSGLTALHLAAHNGHRDVAAALLAHGADVNARTLTYPIRTPLSVAVIMHRVELAEILLEHGADPELPNEMGWRPLHIAALRGYADIVRVLLAHGADANVVDGAKSTPLALAERRGHADIVALLHEASRADPPPSTARCKDETGQAPARPAETPVDAASASRSYRARPRVSPVGGRRCR